MFQLRDRYLLDSNRESGLGRYVLMLTPRTAALPGFVIEIKRLDQDAGVAVLEDALADGGV